MSREYPDHPRIGVGVVILGEKGVLLIRRAKPPRQGQWSLPGGAQKLGETVFEAAIREVQEETGLNVEIQGLIDVVDSITKDDKRVRYHYTLVDLLALEKPGEKPGEQSEGNLKAGSDAAEAAWIALDDIPGLGLWSETERIIKLGCEMRDALS